MKRQVVFAFVGGLALTVGLIDSINHNPAFGTVLDGFSINTRDKAVTVTLYTDQRAKYSTENQGRQFTIVLPETQLSQKQLDNGLPVVIDNKNRFIGRAVPTGDGKVKIILPNLPAGEYAVSIQQQRVDQGHSAELPMATVKPRAAIQSIPESRFEQVAASFAKPAADKAPTEGTALQATGADEPQPVYGKASRGTIWNPYVVKRSPVYSAPRKVTRHPAQIASDEPETASSQAGFSTMKLSPTPERVASLAPAMPALPPVTMPLAPPTNDKLWYLHSLPPANPNVMPTDSLQGPAQPKAAVDAAAGTPKTDEKTAKPPAPSEKSVVKKARSTASTLLHALLPLPSWLWMALAFFLSGIGLFALVGALVLLKLLFSQLRPLSYGGLQQPMFVYPVTTPYGARLSMPNVQPLPETKPAFAKNAKPKSSRKRLLPEALQEVKFQDTVSVNAMDYMKTVPSTVSDAVQNAILIKFPSQRTARKPRVLRAASGSPYAHLNP
jgi:hypothetical protein